MGAVISVLVVVTVSLLIIRVAAVALALTGISRDAARFQALSAFTGVGFTTDEAQQVVSHPVRRRIIMLLMIAGSAGVVTAVSSLILTFMLDDTSLQRLWRLVILAAGLVGLAGLATRPTTDRVLSRLINWALTRWTDLDVHDYAALLRLTADYGIRQFAVREDSCLAGQTLRDLGFSQQGVLVIGIHHVEDGFEASPTGDSRILAGDELVLYGQMEIIRDIDQHQQSALPDLLERCRISRQVASGGDGSGPSD